MTKNITRNILMALCVFLIAVTSTLYYTLFKIDASSQPIDSTSIPEVLGAPYQHREPVILVNYAHGPEVFFKNQNALLQSALGKGFDLTMSYRRGHLDPVFFTKNKDILDQKRGAGYWLWKPYLILKTMEMYPDNTVIVYADSGVVMSKPIAPLLKELNKKPMIFTRSNELVPLRAHLKKEAQQRLGLSALDPRLNAPDLWAFFMVLKNTTETRAFVKEWLALCEMKDVLTDVPFNPDIQEKGFLGHLHDQSLLSLVAANHPDKTIIFTKDVLRTTYGVMNFHRHPQEEFTSPLMRSAGVPKWLATFLFNNKIAQKIRQNFF
jgi:hypothetical protein